MTACPFKPGFGLRWGPFYCRTELSCRSFIRGVHSNPIPANSCQAPKPTQFPLTPSPQTRHS